MQTALTKREINYNVFAGGKVPHVFFQPRLEPWFHWHKAVRPDLMPPRWANANIYDFYADLNLSMRYIDYYTGVPWAVEVRYAKKVKREVTQSADTIVEVFHTPKGDLRTVSTLTSDKTWWSTEFLLKTPEDFPAFAWLMSETEYHFNTANFDKGAKALGDRGEPQFYLPKSPYQRLALEQMRLQDFIFALADVPDAVEGLFAAMDRAFDPLFQEIVDSGKVRVVNFGENIHVQHLSPAYFERYLIPYYQKRSEQLRRAGIFTHIHIDGHFGPLLKYLKDLPFDGLEALTPLPQGDVSIPQIREHIGGKVLLDGIPAIYFTPTYPADVLMECVETLVQSFHPRLVLGISDEIPEGADESQLDKVRLVRDYCLKTTS